jgi:hypothetical protein
MKFSVPFQSAKLISILKESMKKDTLSENPRPVCFGDEAKFVTYMEAPAGDAECASCPSENECGEFIIFKCSRELTF